MNELPDLALYRLFDHLDLADRMSCRLVNKRFLLLIDSLPSKELTIQYNENGLGFGPLRPLRWFDDFQPINQRNIILILTNIQLPKLNLLASRYCCNLKKLHLDLSQFSRSDLTDGKPLNLDLRILNNFTQLKTLLIHLPARLFDHSAYDCTEPVVLKNLVNLFVYINDFYLPGNEYTEAELLKLDCENLNFLELKRVSMSPLGNTLHLKHPEQVKHLRLWSENFEHNVQFLNTFKCVRELDCHLSKPSEVATLIRLIDGYQELQVLSVQFVKILNTVFDLEVIEQLRRHLRTTRPSLVVYLNGLRMGLFDQLKLLPQEGYLDSQLDFYLQNHRSTSKFLRQFNFLSYNRWEPFELRKQIPEGFLRKLVNLSSIVVDGRVEDANTLIDLLSKYELISCLVLTNSSLDQTFYSNLSRCTPNLRNLSIVDDPKLVESLNFYVLSELNHLAFFSVNRPLDFDLAYSLFINSFNTKQLGFLIDGRHSQLCRSIYNCQFRDRQPIDDENLKPWASKLAEDYNAKYEERLKLTTFRLPVEFIFYYRDNQ